MVPHPVPECITDNQCGVHGLFVEVRGIAEVKAIGG
jgi:hypothetical protein